MVVRISEMNFHQKPWRPEENETSLKCCKKKKQKTINIDYLILKNILQR